jgi:DUF1680 family protein
VPGYAYAVGDDGPYVNLFVDGDATLDVGGKRVNIQQKTRYPWDGKVEITVSPESAVQEFALHVRVPGWSRGEAWPSNLYSFLNPSQQKPALELNDEAQSVEPVKGYAVIDRAWKPGDKVTLTLPMPTERVIANEQVVADRGRVALLRGPLVYCVEGVDVEGGQLGDLVLPDDAPLNAEFRSDLLGGVEVVQTAAKRAVAGQSESPAVPVTAIPYYAWANRGKGAMVVWLPRTPAAIHSEDPADKK